MYIDKKKNNVRRSRPISRPRQDEGEGAERNNLFGSFASGGDNNCARWKAAVRSIDHADYSTFTIS